MLQALKDIFSVLRRNEIGDDVIHQCRSRFMASLVFFLAASAMLAMNLLSHSILMAQASVVLMIGFGINMIVAAVLHKSQLSGVITMLLVGFVLTLFAVSGGNQGFALLWLLFVPVFAVSLVGLIPGIILSCYFMVLLCFLFYGPGRPFVTTNYNTVILSRFPVMYAADLVLSLYQSLQKEYYFRKMQISSYKDALTGANTRTYFEKWYAQHSKNSSEPLCIIMIDLNGLKRANDTKGHAAGDELLCGLVTICRETFGDAGEIFRMGGDEFLVVLHENGSPAEELILSLKEKMLAWQGSLNHEVRFAVGSSCRAKLPGADIDTLMRTADENMYADKAAYYRVNDRRKR